jgi:serine/threonine protein kinase
MVQPIKSDSIVAGFRVMDQIGIGSAGEVWLGRDGTQTVAIKFLNATLLESPNHETHLHRFQNEAQSLQKMSDLAHIPTHIHHDLEVERPYIVMEFIESPAFSDLLAQGEMLYIPLPQRLNALQRIAETLSIVHQRDIVHRDIKPGNIHGIRHPYLLDFSIGIPVEEAENVDRRVGTPLYLTPDLLPPSARTDGYGFAIVMYEIIFGRHPIFDYRNVPENTDELRQQASRAILNETWHRPNQLTEMDLPVNLKGAELDQLTTVFQNAFMLSDDRYADMQVFMNDVMEAVHVAENVPYLDAVPLPTDDVGGQQIGDVEHLTDHLVAVYSANTDLPDETSLGGFDTRQWIIGLSVLFGILFMVLMLLVFSPS